MTAGDGLATEVVRALDAAGVKVTDIAVRSASLDDVFLTLTGHKAPERSGHAEEYASDDHGGTLTTGTLPRGRSRRRT